MAVLTNLASMQRAFYRLTDTAADDDSLIEHDDSTLEGVNQFLQYGANDAQDYMMDCGLSDRWVSQATAITSWSGTESSDGGRYKPLESDFFRLSGDDATSALRKIDGTRWGQLVDFRDRFKVRGNRYWLQGTNLWIARGANPPASLIYDYHHRIATLSSATVDFPSEDRPLIVAYAAERAMQDSWLPGGQEMMVKLSANRRACEQRAFRRARRSRTMRKLRPKPTIGTHYFT
jgi:hypothetical protein|tara:strand:- start:878 stop:1576 length:699 start_codon:yes stop_codon:yes gene_type:complete